MSLLFENYFDLQVKPEAAAAVEEDQIELPVYEGAMEIEELPYVVCEFAENMYKLEAGLYIADAVMEHKMLNGEDITAVAEATVKDYVMKATGAIRAFVSKVVAWFKQIIENIRSTGVQGEMLVKKFGDKLKKKAAEVKDFDYEITDYEFSALKSFSEKIGKHDVIAEAGLTAVKSVSDKIASNAAVDDRMYASLTEAKGKLKKRDEVKAEIESLFVNPGKVKFSASHIGQCIDFVGNYKGMLNSAKKCQTEFEKRAKDVIKAIEKFEKQMDKTTDAANVIRACVTVGKETLVYSQAVYAETIGVARKAYIECFGVLRKLAAKRVKGEKEEKPAKESMEETSIPSDESLLETIMVSF